MFYFIIVSNYILTSSSILTASQTGILDYTNSTKSFCSNFINFTFITKQSTIKKSYDKTVIKLYSNNPINLFVKKIFTQGIIQKQQLNNPTAFLTLIIQTIIPLAILLILSPLIISLCCCQNTCSFQICLRNDDIKNKCQKALYPILATIFLIILIALSITGIVKSDELGNSAKRILCQSLKLVDATRNGKMNENNSSFFVGIKPGIDKLQNLLQSQDSIKQRAGKLQQQIDSFKKKNEEFNKQIQKNYSMIPNYSYSNAFYQNDGVSAITIQSNFKQMIIGPLQNNNTIFGRVTHFINKGYQNIIQVLNQTKTSTTFIANSKQLHIKKGIFIMEDFNQTISSLFQNILKNPLAFQRIIRYTSISFFLIIIIFVIISIIPLFLYIIFQKPSCLFFFYVTSISLLLVFLITVLSSTFLAIVNPATFTFCDSIDSLLSNQTAIKTLSLKLGQQSSDMLSGCLSGQSLISNLNNQFTDSINHINTITKHSLNSDILTNSEINQSTINNIKQYSYELINSFFSSKILDINDTRAIQHLKRLANKSYPTAGCSANIHLDSWIPNVLQQIIFCDKGTKTVPSNCSDLDNKCSNRCFGLNQQLGTKYNDCRKYNCTVTASIHSQLNNRYNPGCRYINLIQNLNKNYDELRQDLAIDGIKPFVQENIFPELESYYTLIQDISQQFNKMKSLIKSFNKSLDLDSGIVAGFNCQAIRQQLDKGINMICTDMYTNLIEFNTILILLSYTILIAIINLAITINRYNRYFKFQVQSVAQGQVVQEVISERINIV